MKKSNPIALLPIGVFLVIYLGLGLLFKYGLKINMGFYNIPIVVAFLIALLVACLQNRELSFDAKLELMGHGIGDKNIVTMILIFMAAGIFVGVVGRSSAESVAYLLLSHVPSQYSVVILFVVSCFVSLAMGTSVGTITLITPIAAPLAVATGFSLPFCVASVIGGAMFGDNLSFISDTTIAACNGQGCQMKDKFRENFKIALPAALLSLAIILIISLNTPIEQFPIIKEYNLIQIIPYILVLAGGIIGINVFVVLLIGILSGSIIMLATGEIAATSLLKNMGTGAEDMFETTMVAILVSAICALIREYGGTLEHFWIEAVKDRTDAEYLDAREIPASLVTDLATDPNGTVLQAANGRPAQIYVIVPVDGALRIASGVVYNFYQFRQPLSARLTDTEWRQMIGEWMSPDGRFHQDETPEKPGWTQSYWVQG